MGAGLSSFVVVVIIFWPNHQPLSSPPTTAITTLLLHIAMYCPYVIVHCHLHPLGLVTVCHATGLYGHVIQLPSLYRQHQVV